MAEKQYYTTNGYTQEQVAIIGPELERLAHKYKKGDTSELNAWDVLREAEQPKSPLRPFLEWDNLVAATEHRLNQCRHMCRHIRYRIIEHDVVTHDGPLFVNVSGTERDVETDIGAKRLKTYILRDDVADDAELSERAIEDAVRYILSGEKRLSERKTMFAERYPKSGERVLQALEALKSERLEGTRLSGKRPSRA